jgi:hypothetical protein
MQLVVKRRDCLNFFRADVWAQHAHDSNRPFVDGPLLCIDTSNVLSTPTRESFTAVSG